MATNPRGRAERLGPWVERAGELDADALALIGDVSAPGHDTAALAEALKALGHANLPAYYVPGPGDAPLETYLSGAYHAELVFPQLRGVHGTFAFGPGHVAFAGMGGRVEEGPGASREEDRELRYPAFEVEYRLKPLRELRDYPLVFLFATPPAHKGRGEVGSQTLAELVKTYDPVAVLAPGPETEARELGRSLVARVGPLATGDYAVVDLAEGRVEPGRLS